MELNLKKMMLQELWRFQEQRSSEFLRILDGQEKVEMADYNADKLHYSSIDIRKHENDTNFVN